MHACCSIYGLGITRTARARAAARDGTGVLSSTEVTCNVRGNCPGGWGSGASVYMLHVHIAGVADRTRVDGYYEIAGENATTTMALMMAVSAARTAKFPCTGWVEHGWYILCIVDERA